jgi:hypothetical protein
MVGWWRLENDAKGGILSLRQRPVGAAGFNADLQCDRCGRPAEWRHRVTSARCMVGEALCEQCESRRAVQWGRDSYWFDLKEDARWLAGQMGTVLGRLKWSPVKLGNDRLLSKR